MSFALSFKVISLFQQQALTSAFDRPEQPHAILVLGTKAESSVWIESLGILALIEAP